VASAVQGNLSNLDESGCHAHPPFDISIKGNASCFPIQWAGQAGYQVSIFEETGGGLGAVAHDRSLELFFDRFEVIARFVALINLDSSRS